MPDSHPSTFTLIESEHANGTEELTKHTTTRPQVAILELPKNLTKPNRQGR